MEDRELIDSFAEMAENYEDAVDSEMSTFWGLNYDTFIDAFLKLVSLNENDSVLDLATGTGVIPEKLAESSNGINIFGLDLTYAMVKTAGNKFRKSSNGNISLTCGNAMEIPLADSSINAVTCALATHHMNSEKLVREIKRVIKPGGWLYLTDVGMAGFLRLPIIGSLVKAGTYLYFWRTQGRSRARTEMTAVKNVLTIEEWNSLLHEQGLVDIKIKTVQSKYFWVPPPVQITARKKRE